MVPTELLAIQHHEHFLRLLENIDIECKPSVALLTGSTPARQSRIIREAGTMLFFYLWVLILNSALSSSLIEFKGLRNGDISMVIGTHSLIAEKVEFSALRIAVVDEQHRFGVVQRGRFNSKVGAFCPHLNNFLLFLKKKKSWCTFKIFVCCGFNILVLT